MAQKNIEKHLCLLIVFSLTLIFFVLFVLESRLTNCDKHTYKHTINKFDLTAAIVAKQQVSEDLNHCMSCQKRQTDRSLTEANPVIQKQTHNAGKCLFSLHHSHFPNETLVRTLKTSQLVTQMLAFPPTRWPMQGALKPL